MSCMKSFRSEFCLLQEASLVLGSIHFLQYASNEIVIFQKLECNQSFSQPCFYISSADVLAYLVIGLFCCRCCKVHTNLCLELGSTGVWIVRTSLSMPTNLQSTLWTISNSLVQCFAFLLEQAVVKVITAVVKAPLKMNGEPVTGRHFQRECKTLYAFFYNHDLLGCHWLQYNLTPSRPKWQ